MMRRTFLAGSLAVPAVALAGRTDAAATGPTLYSFKQVDVFAGAPLKGNPLAVVVGADHLTEEQMADFADWTNLSETTFLLKPTDPQADYRVRIFGHRTEFPFAGHPTLGTCHVWRELGGKPKGELVMQQCNIGLVPLRQDQDLLAFAAPPLLKSQDVTGDTLAKIVSALNIRPDQVEKAHRVDNGVPWIAVKLRSRNEVLAVKPDFAKLAPLIVGVFAACDKGSDGIGTDFEVRAFGDAEDPVTGSLNAGLASWLIGERLAPASYVVSQGTVLGRAGRVYVRSQGTSIWIGGKTNTIITGKAEL